MQLIIARKGDNNNWPDETPDRYVPMAEEQEHEGDIDNEPNK